MIDYITVAILITLSGTFSGLTIGMFSLDLGTLKRRIRLGDKRAVQVYSVRKKGNLLLCTLLLGNVTVNAATAIILGSITTGVAAGSIATGLIVIFGEILPQAVFTRFALKLGAKTIWLTRFFIIILYPVSWPIAWILDKMLGRELPVIWDKREIKEIISYHQDAPESAIDKDEERITIGALSFSDQLVKNIQTPKEVVYWLPGEKKIDRRLILEIKKKGFTRIPVFLKGKTGVLLSKNLLGISEEDGKTVWDLCYKQQPIRTRDTDTLDILLNQFIRKKMHLAFVYNKKNKFVGIVTLEDVIEEIIRQEIVDELDTEIDMRQLLKGNRKKHKTRDL